MARTFAKLILVAKFYQNSEMENKSVSSVYVVYVLVFYSFVCCVLLFMGAKIRILQKAQGISPIIFFFAAIIVVLQVQNNQRLTTSNYHFNS